MKKYIVAQPCKFPGGRRMFLSPAQVVHRPTLEPLGDGLYLAKDETQWKKGEVIGFESAAEPALAVSLELIESEPKRAKK